jgi:hypothetical protein
MIHTRKAAVTGMKVEKNAPPCPAGLLAVSLNDDASNVRHKPHAGVMLHVRL